MVHLKEHCLFCGRELNPFELAVVLDTEEEKRTDEVTFREKSATEGYAAGTASRRASERRRIGDVPNRR